MTLIDMKEQEFDILTKFADPYDLWMTDFGVGVRARFYRGDISGKIGAVLVGLADWLLPELSRSFLKSRKRVFPITVAQLIMMQRYESPESALKALLSCAVADNDQFGMSWGLGFPWMSKNGFYSAETPFITHTPYAMEALAELAQRPEIRDLAFESFRHSWEFLDVLHIMIERDGLLAVSYAPKVEPRIVINANSYAAFAYALHSKYNVERREEALDRARQLIRFVVSTQNADGSWYYYADDKPGNFIDCFHTCFVLKNLHKVAQLDAESSELVGQAITSGKQFVDEHLFDVSAGLVRRFTTRDIKDPFTWDIYDQAEYLGILIDAGEIDKAKTLRDRAIYRFHDGRAWYCRIDIAGRRWGRNFGRWGIVPFLYQVSRLESV